MAYYFGAGELLVGGAGGTVAGTLQDVSLDINFNTVTLHGSKQFPVAVARGPASVKGRAKSAEVQGAMIGRVLGTAASDGPNTLTNADMGAGLPCEVRWRGTYNGKTVVYTLHACVLSKYNFAVKNDNFYSSDIEFEAFAAAITPVKASFAGPSTGYDSVIEFPTAGAAGNFYSLRLVGDSGTGAGETVTKVGNAVTVHYESGVSTVADVDAAIDADGTFDVKTAGTGARVLTAPAANVAATLLAGGFDANGVLTYSIV